MGALSGPIRDEVLLGIRDVELISFNSATEIFAAVDVQRDVGGASKRGGGRYQRLYATRCCLAYATWKLFAASSCAFLELSAVGSYATGELIAANSSCSICPPKRLWGFGGDGASAS